MCVCVLVRVSKRYRDTEWCTVRSFSMLFNTVSSCSSLWISSKRIFLTCSSFWVLHREETVNQWSGNRSVFGVQEEYSCTNRVGLEHWILTVDCAVVFVNLVDGGQPAIKLSYILIVKDIIKVQIWCYLWGNMTVNVKVTNYRLTDLCLVTCMLREETCCWTVFKECLL